VKNINLKTKGVLFIQDNLKKLEDIIEDNFGCKMRTDFKKLTILTKSQKEKKNLLLLRLHFILSQQGIYQMKFNKLIFFKIIV
jgi:hypothetical protein